MAAEMPLDTATLLRRIDQLLATQFPAGDIEGVYAAVAEAMQGTLTLARTLYGATEETPHVHTLMKAAQLARGQKLSIAFSFHETVWPLVQGSLRAIRADVEAGLVGNIERRAAGEVIADMLGLAKEALREGTDGAENVAAVLAAASYEDTIRKMGSALAGVVGRPDLSDILNQLKAAGVLVGAPLSTALGYLKFRNDALHADWQNINAAVVGSCIAFVEGLILQHLS